ncbi:MAG: hypothetical protein MI702_08525, partial [Chlorobiales bacterium]|nr:hypothetical protein [Chlorobiales bacterium]
SNEALSAEQRDEAKELLTQYEGLAHFHRSQFEAWMAMGLAFMKQGEADRAENAFTLAAQYEAEHPRALAAKFVVLLTQAEYTRSALFLGRALAGESAYAAHPEALPLTMAAEQIKQHIRALETTLQTVPAPELLFLVGYLYYLQDDVRLAHHALVRAQASKVSLPGLATLFAAVEARLAKNS